VQKCLERANQSDVKFILEEIIGHAKEMSLKQYSCHVIQKVIECCGASAETRIIMGELLPFIIELTKDKHGNYVVQSVIKNGSSTDQTYVIEKFKHNLLSLSQDKFASNVVEITLRNCTL